MYNPPTSTRKTAYAATPAKNEKTMTICTTLGRWDNELYGLTDCTLENIKPTRGLVKTVTGAWSGFMRFSSKEGKPSHGRHGGSRKRISTSYAWQKNENVAPGCATSPGCRLPQVFAALPLG
jgi:hypothetical protein